MAWIDVRKAYDSVDHHWLNEMFTIHRFPKWIARESVVKLTGKWNTKISVRPLQGADTSERIKFSKGFSQPDALCPSLFTLSLNAVAWKLKATEGYRLSKPIKAEITDLLYIDDEDFRSFRGEAGASYEGDQKNNEQCRLTVEREEVCSSTVGGVGWNENWSILKFNAKNF